jgi:photosystem II stability/assembly factor-like uncharacterized protein
MKIFGSTRFNSTVQAPSASFNKFLLNPQPTAPVFYVAGSDTEVKVPPTDFRNIVAQGLYDYVVYSTNTGDTIQQKTSVPAGSVMGYKIQHAPDRVGGQRNVYSLVTETQTSAANGKSKSRINVSTDSGETMKVLYEFPTNFYAFDMHWQSNTKCYVVGARVEEAIPGVIVNWKKFNSFGRDLFATNVATLPETGKKAYYPAAYYSEDGGQTFTEITFASGEILNPEDAITSVSVDGAENFIVYGTENGLIYRSSINDKTVVSVRYRGNSIVNRISFANDGTTSLNMFAAIGGSFGKVLKSTSSGNTWTSATELAGIRYAGAIYDVISPSKNIVFAVGDDYSKILKSSDNGVTWKFVPSGINSNRFPLIDIRAIKRSGTNTSEYFALSKNGVFRSISRANIWNDPNLANLIDWAVALNTTQGKEFLAFDCVEDAVTNSLYTFVVGSINNTVYEILAYNSTNGRLDGFALPADTEKPVAVFARSASEIYIITENSKIIRVSYLETTGGFSFTSETSNVSEELYSLSGGKNGSPNTGNLLFSAGANGTVIYKDYTDSDPITWTALTAPTDTGHGTEDVIQIQAISDTVLYALTYDTTNDNSYVYKSTDGGTSWGSPLIESTGQRYIKFIVYTSNGNTIITCLNEDGQTIITSQDDGLNWSTFTDVLYPGTVAIEHDSSVIDRSATPSSRGYVLGAGSKGVFLSNYSTFLKIGVRKESPISLVGIAATPDQSGNALIWPIWVCGGTTDGTGPSSEPYLLKSTDRGDTWEDVSSVLPLEPPGGDYILTSITENSYFEYTDYDRFFIYGSNDKGNTFTKHDSRLFTKYEKFVNPNKPPKFTIKDIFFASKQVGYAIANIGSNTLPVGQGTLVKTQDGGITWTPLSFTSNVTPKSIWFTDNNTGYIAALVDATAPDYNTADFKIFKTTTGGASWSVIYTQTPPLVNRAGFSNLVITFTNSTTGYVIYKNEILKTTNSGTSWFSTTIDNINSFEPNDISFVTVSTAYAGGAYSAGGGLTETGLYKTTNSGASWSKITLPTDGQVDTFITAVYYLTEKIAFVATNSALGALCEIYQTKNADVASPTWAKLYTIQPFVGQSSTGEDTRITNLKFSKDGAIGVAVGYRGGPVTNDTTIFQTTDHFIIISTDGGNTWEEIDKGHVQVDLELYGTRGITNSRLDAIAFTERRTLTGTTPPDPPLGPGAPDFDFDPWTENPDEDPPAIGSCFETQFLSASYYNLENFAYKCTAFDADGKPLPPIYYPNVSENVGLGRNIFGQLGSTPRTTLKTELTYGAALGVNALGTAIYSKNDTAVGYGAMDLLTNANNNVAVGYKALSSNKAYSITNLQQGIRQLNTNMVGITQNEIYTSGDGGTTWQPLQATSSLPVVSFAPTESSQIVYTQTLSTSDSISYILGNDKNLSESISNTYIFKSSDSNRSFDLIYSSSAYTVSRIEYVNSDILYGLDKENGYVIKTTNGGYVWNTGSIQGFSENTINTFKILSQNSGFLVGSRIWEFASGSTLNWITSSYSGSNIINSIESVDSLTWIAVGTSGSIYKTTDSGNNWMLLTQSLATQSLNVIKRAANGNILVAGDFGKIIYSTDIGNTWKTGSYFTTESYSAYNYTSIQSTPFDEYVLNSESGSVISNNFGETWSEYLPANVNNVNILQSSTNTALPISIELNKQLSDILLFGTTPDSLSALITEEQKDYVLENVSVGALSINSNQNAWGMVAVGARALANSSAVDSMTYANNNEFIIDGYRDFIYNDPIDISLGLLRPSNYGQVAIGRFSQGESINTGFNTSVGYGSLYLSQESTNNTAIGFYSQHLNNNNRNTSLGVWALGINGKIGTNDEFETGIEFSSSFGGGSDNIAIGYKALLNNITSNRAIQINSALNTIDASSGFVLGSRNVAIGNRSLVNASGSTNIVSIGHQAVFSGNDLTDSVFVGAYVGTEFKTPQGTYYSSSQDNDWKPTQTVAVGSYAIQNHVGTDIVAVGANALRGTPLGSNPIDNNDDSTRQQFGVILAGGINGAIYSQADYKKMFDWKRPVYTTKKSDSFNILDDIKQLRFGNASNGFTFQDIKIVDKDTAYGLFILKDGYPRLLKANNYSLYTNGVRWDSVQHTDKFLRPAPSIKGTIDIGPASSAKISAPDADNVYILSRGSRYGVYKSANGGGSFTTALDAKTKLPQGGAIKLFGIHFPNAQSGSVVGIIGDVNKSTTCAPVVAFTYDGGDDWSLRVVDNTETGRNVGLNSVWFDETHTIGYACGTFGSIYKSENRGSTWTKLIGASISTNFVGSVYSDLPNDLSYRSSFTLTDIFFINASVGWAVGYSPVGKIGKGYLLRTTDGGTTWNKTSLDYACTRFNAKQEPIVAPTKVRAMDANNVFISSIYGIVFWSDDGGSTVQWNYSLPLTMNPGLTRCPGEASPALDVFLGDVVSSTERDPNSASVSQSVAVGADIQVKQDFVENNVGIGYKVQFNGSGSAIDSVQIGASATINSNFVRDTVAIGKDALNKTNYSDKTTAVGKNSLYFLRQSPSAVPFPGPVFTYNGKPKDFTNSTINTVVGYQAGVSLIVGDSNVFIGANAGIFDNPSVTTFGSNNINIGTNSPKYAFNISDQIAIGNAYHTLAILWGQGYAPQPWWVQSDIRDKADTGSFNLGLNFIRQIQPKEFKWDVRSNYPSGSIPDGTFKQSGSSYGYIAQDIEAAADAVGVSGSLFILNTSGSYSGSSDPSGSDAFPLKLITPGIIDLVVFNAVKELDTTVSFLSASKYTTNLGNGSDTTYPVTHSLNTRDVIAMVHDNITKIVVYPTMSIDGTNTMTVTFPTTATPNQYRLVVMR